MTGPQYNHFDKKGPRDACFVPGAGPEFNTNTYNKQKHLLGGILFFDIETESNPFAMAEHARKLKKPIKAGALDVDFAQIKSISLAYGSDEPKTRVVGSVDTVIGRTSEEGILVREVKFTEREVLTRFWVQVERANRLAGFNILGFDLPILIRRSWILGVEPTVPPIKCSPYNKNLLDFMRIVYYGGYGPGPRWRGLKFFCSRYADLGLSPRPELDDLSGDQVAEMDEEQLRAYNNYDVERVQEIARSTHGWYWT